MTYLRRVQFRSIRFGRFCSAIMNRNILFFPIYFILSQYRYICLWIKGLYKDEFCIKSDYCPRSKYIQFDDRNNADEYQDAIYKQIRNFAFEVGASRILDIGCGSAFKLLKYLDKFDTLGLEMPNTFEYLKKKYPDRNWCLSNFNNPPIQKFDIVISVDVIDHLLHTDELLVFIKKINCDYVILSTPDRSKLGIFAQYRPINIYHVREWSRDEFVDYVSINFSVIKSEVLDHHDHFLIAIKR
jgi:hypothetical protein